MSKICDSLTVCDRGIEVKIDGNSMTWMAPKNRILSSPTHSLFSLFSSGAQDFLPDFERTSRWYSVYRIYPKYGPVSTAMRKVKEWMHNARVINYI